LKQDGAADVVVIVKADWWIIEELGAGGFTSVGWAEVYWGDERMARKHM